jgi:hypothetical protein
MVSAEETSVMRLVWRTQPIQQIFVGGYFQSQIAVFTALVIIAGSADVDVLPGIVIALPSQFLDCVSYSLELLPLFGGIL